MGDRGGKTALTGDFLGEWCGRTGTLIGECVGEQKGDQDGDFVGEDPIPMVLIESLFVPAMDEAAERDEKDHDNQPPLYGWQTANEAHPQSGWSLTAPQTNSPFFIPEIDPIRCLLASSSPSFLSCSK